MVLCNTACSASSVGAGTSVKTWAPTVPLRYSPSSTRQCRRMFRLAAEAIVKVRLDQHDRAAAGWWAGGLVGWLSGEPLPRIG